MKHWLTRYRQYVLRSLLATVLGVSLCLTMTSPVLADNEVTCSDGTTVQASGDPAAACKDHGGVKSSDSTTGDPSLTCNVLPQDICDSAKSGSDVQSSGILKFLKWILTVLTAVVGIAAVGTLTWAGIMYASAGDDSGMVSKAKTIIRDTVIGIVAYGLMVVALNWIIPGGVIG